MKLWQFTWRHKLSDLKTDLTQPSWLRWILLISPSEMMTLPKTNKSPLNIGLENAV